MKRLLLALGLVVLASPAPAQNAITQEGSVIQNSPMMFRGNNRARQGATVSGAPTGQIVTTGLGIAGGICDFSGPSDTNGGYYNLCLDATTGKIKLGGTKLPQLGLQIEINGVSYNFPGSPTGIGTETYPFPALSFSELTSIVVGGPYPPEAQLTPGVAGFSSKMVVPNTATQTPHPNSPITAWVKSNNMTAGNSSTAYFGGSFSGADGANPYGMALTTCNCDGFGALPGTGHQFAGAMIGYEIDMEVLSRPGGLAPSGQAVGYLAVTASDIQPVNGSIAFKAFDGGGAGGFSYPFYSEDGAGLVAGLRLGTKTRASDTPDANGQPIEFRARTAGVTETATLQYQQGGNLIFFPGKPGGSLATTGHLGAATVPATTVTVSACGAGASAGTSNDTRGVITVGTGTNTCTVTFGQAFASIPACVLTHSGALATGFTALQPDHMILGFPLTATPIALTYLCLQ